MFWGTCKTLGSKEGWQALVNTSNNKQGKEEDLDSGAIQGLRLLRSQASAERRLSEYEHLAPGAQRWLLESGPRPEWHG